MTASAPSRDRITYVGHATVLVELGGVRLLTDPVLRERLLRVIHRHPAAPAPGVAERIDGVLISHLHHDHLDFPSLKQIEGDARLVVPAGAARTLRRRGYPAAIELRPGEATRVGAAEIVATRAVHEGRRYKFGPPVQAAGYVISAAGRRVYFAGDTDLFDEMDELAGAVDVALLPIAGWGPRLGAGHLNPHTAAEATARIRPDVVIPIHWGTMVRHDMRERAKELLAEPARRFAAQVAELAPGVEVRVLEPGEAFDFG